MRCKKGVIQPDYPRTFCSNVSLCQHTPPPPPNPPPPPIPFAVPIRCCSMWPRFCINGFVHQTAPQHTEVTCLSYSWIWSVSIQYSAFFLFHFLIYNHYCGCWGFIKGLLGLRVRIPSAVWDVCLLCVVRCRSLGRVDRLSRGVVPCAVFMCDRETSIMRGSWPTRASCAMEKVA